MELFSIVDHPDWVFNSFQNLLIRLRKYFTQAWSTDHTPSGYWVVMAVIYLWGAFLWGYFLSWGNIDFSFHDWFEITGPRLFFLKDAIVNGLLPLHMNNTSALVLLTDRYLSIPDMLLSPQVLLLWFMDPGQFVLVNWLMSYSLGFWGLVIFARRFNLSLLTFLFIFILFNFNGHAESHLSAGHNTWVGYLLLPWLVIFVLELKDQPFSWRWIGKMAGFLLILFLQGSFHLFVAILLLLGFLALSFPKQFWLIILSGVFACLLSAVRIFPASLIVSSVHQQFLGGFPGVWDLFSGLLIMQRPNAIIQGINNAMYAWEFDFYIGGIGVAFLGYFGIYQWIRHPKISWCYSIPLAGMTLLAMGELYRVINILPIPIFQGERVTTRFLVLPLVFLIFLSGVNCQQWLDNRKSSLWIDAGLLLAFLVMSIDLWNHLQLWRLDSILQLFAENRYLFDATIWVTANYPDSLYFGILRRGLIVSLLSAVFLVFAAWKNPPLKKSYSTIKKWIYNLIGPGQKIEKNPHN